jgi:endonuclease/exonuclease/phosphatase family metal-dependent hydrolase
LQETDATHISLNNNDYLRYYAEKLGYYSYYGPTTVTGTYGTAILSKVPLMNTRTVFTYSDQDEIGVAEAEVEASGQRVTIYDVHPDGSDAAKLVFARSLLERSKDKLYVIAIRGMMRRPIK